MPSTQNESRALKSVSYKSYDNLSKLDASQSILEIKKAASSLKQNEDDKDCNKKQRSSNSELNTIDYRYHMFIDKRQFGSCTSSFLRPGSRFIGTQQSGRSVYEVNVDIKYIDTNEAFICGYLRIEGLTEELPMLITYFEGEMISEKHPFFCSHHRWGGNKSTDLDHWKRFEPWRNICQEAQEPDYVHDNYTEREHIYMKWKEEFLVPDCRVREVQGASYAGFYYICFDQINGSICGFYYHHSSDMYQQLNLTHVPDEGCVDTFEFR